MDDFQRLLNKEWDDLELRYTVIKQLIKLRNSYNLSQTQLAKKVGIDFLEKIAKAFDKKVELRIV